MTLTRKNTKSRLPLAITLIVASFASAIAISIVANKGNDYWVVSAPVNIGHTISSSDISIVHMNLNSSSQLYLGKEMEPIGMVATRSLNTGQIISTTDLSISAEAMSTSAVPISVRSVDAASSLMIGELVDIYWVLDSRNGEVPVDPILILGGVTILSVDAGDKGFGTEIGLTIAVEETQVLRLLSATTQGRLVVISSRV